MVGFWAGSERSLAPWENRGRQKDRDRHVKWSPLGNILCVVINFPEDRVGREGRRKVGREG